MVLIDSDREKHSASHEPSLNESELDFHGFSGQKRVLGLSESASDLSYYPTNFEKKYDIYNQHTELYLTV